MTTKAARAPVAGALVTLGTSLASTDASGRATLAAPAAPGSYQLGASAPGLVPVVPEDDRGGVRPLVAQLPLALAALALRVALALAGCGLGAGRAPSGVQLLVTPRLRRERAARDERAPGARAGDGDEPADAQLRGEHALLRAASCRASTGSPAGSEGGQPVDWFYYVNGVEASKGAASTNVHPGDHIWWDRHDWSQTERRARGRRLLPRAVPQRPRRQAPARARRMRRGAERRLPDGRSTGCARAACPAAIAGARAAARAEDAARARRAVERRRGATPRAQTVDARPARERRLRALRRGRSHADAARRRRARRAHAAAPARG